VFERQQPVAIRAFVKRRTEHDNRAQGGGGAAILIASEAKQSTGSHARRPQFLDCFVALAGSSQ
jgi:hypothetical protein